MHFSQTIWVCMLYKYKLYFPWFMFNIFLLIGSVLSRLKHYSLKLPQHQLIYISLKHTSYREKLFCYACVLLSKLLSKQFTRELTLPINCSILTWFWIEYWIKVLKKTFKKISLFWADANDELYIIFKFFSRSSSKS